MDGAHTPGVVGTLGHLSREDERLVRVLWLPRTQEGEAEPTVGPRAHEPTFERLTKRSLSARIVVSAQRHEPPHFEQVGGAMIDGAGALQESERALRLTSTQRDLCSFRQMVRGIHA